jgi:hypothetical protein
MAKRHAPDRERPARPVVSRTGFALFAICSDPGGGVFERAQTLAQRKPGDAHPFVDNAARRQWLVTARAGTIKYVDDAKAGRPVR